MNEKALRMSVDSPTGASADIYLVDEPNLRVLEDAFPGAPRTMRCGAWDRSPPLCLDLVSRPDAFARLWPKLRAGYLLDALERLDGKPTAQSQVESFVSTVDRSEHARQPSAGLGEDVRMRGEHVIGSALELEGEVVQLSAFLSEDGGDVLSGGSRDQARGDE